MKKNITVGCAIFSALAACNAFAADPGFYVGAQLGYASAPADNRFVVVSPSSQTLVPATSGKTTGFAPRIYGGYQINSYLAAEFGGALYPTTDYDTGGVLVCTKPKRELSAFDVVGKGTWEFGDSGFSAYAKAGLAFVTVKETNNLDTTNPLMDCSQSFKKRSIRPELGLGVGYNVSGSSMVDLSYIRIFKGSEFPSINLFALGFTYSFADPHCGQFLC